MERFELFLKNQFFIDKFDKNKIITYKDLKYYQKHNYRYCNNIYKNDKTCKEVGPFRTKQKLMQENDDLRIYRNVYQKLLLRTRRNPDNDQYEKDFEQFKLKNIELKEKIEKGKLTQAEYMEWLEKQ